MGGVLTVESAIVLCEAACVHLRSPLAAADAALLALCLALWSAASRTRLPSREADSGAFACAALVPLALLSPAASPLPGLPTALLSMSACSALLALLPRPRPPLLAACAAAAAASALALHALGAPPLAVRAALVAACAALPVALPAAPFAAGSLTPGEALVAAHALLACLLSARSSHSTAAMASAAAACALFCALCGLLAAFAGARGRRAGPLGVAVALAASLAAAERLLWSAAWPAQPPLALWVARFVLWGPRARVALAAMWAACVALAVAVAAACGGDAVALRKAFHALAAAMFAPAVAADPQLVCVACACAAAAMVALEALRLSLPALAPLRAATAALERFCDGRQDRGDLVVTHVSLVAACAAPVWLRGPSGSLGAPAWFRGVACAAGVVSVGAGDAVASAVGRRYGRTRWPLARAKTVEGSAAAALAMVGVALLFCAGVGEAQLLAEWRTWARVLSAAAVTALVEAHTSQIDNLVLPLHYCIVASLW
eukprot:m51a1_g9736 putative dolichol kinase (492) ;mRNA; r:1534266-1535741